MSKRIILFPFILNLLFAFIGLDCFAENIENKQNDDDISKRIKKLLEKTNSELTNGSDLLIDKGSQNIINENIDNEYINLLDERNKLEDEVENLEKINDELNKRFYKKFEKESEYNNSSREKEDLYNELILNQKINSNMEIADKLDKEIGKIERNIDNEVKIEKDNNKKKEEINNEVDNIKKEITSQIVDIKKKEELINDYIDKTNKLNSKLILLNDSLTSEKESKSFLGKLRNEYKKIRKVETEKHPEKTVKLVVLTQKLDVTSGRTEKAGHIFDYFGLKNEVELKFKDCVIQYYIPLDELKEENIQYDSKTKTLTILSPKVILDEEMLYIQSNPDKIEKKEKKGSWVTFNSTMKKLNDEALREVKNIILEAGKKEDKYYELAEDNAKNSLESIFSRILRKLPESKDIKIKIRFY